MSGETIQHSERGPLLIAELAVAALACHALAQPVLDLVGRTPEFFVVRRSAPIDLWVVGLGLGVALPLLLAGLVALLRPLGATTHRWVSATAIAALSALIGFRMAGRLALPGALWAVAVALGVAVAVAFFRIRLLRTWLALLSLSLVAVPGWFLVRAGQQGLLGSRNAPAAVRQARSQTPIFFLVFDEWPLGSILDENGDVDRRRYPHLARLAATSTWYRNAYTVSSATEQAVPALLTGKFPARGSLPRLEDHPRNLFTLFGGYQIFASESVTSLCPPEINALVRATPQVRQRLSGLASDLSVVWLHQTMPPAVRRRLPPISGAWGDFRIRGETDPVSATPESEFTAVGKLGRGNRIPQWRELLDSIGTTAQPALYFSHLLLPHVPWEYLPSGERYASDDGIRPFGLDEETWSSRSEWMVIQGLQRFLAQSQYVDSEIGNFLDRLESTSLLEDSLIVVVADHGASFRPGLPRRRVVEENAADILSIPLFIKAPGQTRAAVVDSPWPTIRVLPTVLELLGEDEEGSESRESRESEESLGASDNEIVVFRGAGRVRLPASVLERRFEMRDRILELLGSDRSSDGLFAIGTHPLLHGRRVEDLPQSDGQHQVRIRAQTLYDRVEPDSPRGLGFVRGSLERGGGRAAVVPLAVAVDDVIVATTETMGLPGRELEFSALLPPGTLQPGANRLEVFEVVGRGDAVALAATRTVAPVELDLVVEDGAPRALVNADGSLPIGVELEGWIERCRIAAGTLSVSGWAYDPVVGGRIDQVVVFHRGLFVYADSHLPRPVRSRQSAGGFLLEIDGSLVPGFPAEPIRVVAVSSRGVASELPPIYRRLRRGAGGKSRLVGSTGQVAPVRREAISGFIDRARSEAGRPGVLRVGGWAADRALREPVRLVVVFRQGEYYRSFPVDRVRADVARAFGDSEDDGYGFSFPLTSAVFDGLADGSTRVIAVARRGVAGELSPAPGVAALLERRRAASAGEIGALQPR